MAKLFPYNMLLVVVHSDISMVLCCLGHGADVKCVDWHPHKSLVASGSKDTQQPVKLWDPRTGASLATMYAADFTRIVLYLAALN